MKWKNPSKGGILVGLSKPRLVTRVGYEVDFDEACRIVAREAFPTPDTDPKADLDDIKQDKEFNLRIVSNHPKLWKYWDERANLRDRLEDLLEDALAKKIFGFSEVTYVLEAMDHAIVRRMISNRLRVRIRKGEERKIWFTRPPETIMLSDAKEMWRGPWKVLGWRRAYTGTYYPAFGDIEEDFNPAGLARAKAHTLLKVSYAGKMNGWGEHIALKEDTYPWECEVMAQVLSEEV